MGEPSVVEDEERHGELVEATAGCQMIEETVHVFRGGLRAGSLGAGALVLYLPIPDQRPFTPEDVNAILGATERNLAGTRDRALLLLLLDTGICLNHQAVVITVSPVRSDRAARGCLCSETIPWQWVTGSVILAVTSRSIGGLRQRSGCRPSGAVRDVGVCRQCVRPIICRVDDCARHRAERHR